MKADNGGIAIAVALVMCAIIIAMAFRYTPVVIHEVNLEGKPMDDTFVSFDRWTGRH